MARYSYGQLEQLWIQAGGSRALAPLMAAIALAESAGDPQATNPTDDGGTQTSWGLWQISDGTHNRPAPDILTPLGNDKAAVAKYHAQGLTAWGTYDSGAYKQYYRGSVPPSSLPPGGSAGTATDTAWWSSIPGAGLLSTGKTAVDDITHILEWFFHPGNIARIVAFFFGLMLGIPGLYALLKTGSGGTYGDVSLALGILLVTLSGMCFFIAFHNVPADISSIGELFAWVSASVREGRPAGGPATVTPDTGLGARTGQVAGGAVG